jgi:ubiquinone/menaquinone biosynthesis C-methylase UbiE
MSLGFTDFFSDASRQYALARPQYPDSLFEFIAQESPDLSAVWDCGTGNGQAAISLANYFDRVYASDPSQEQISHALSHEKVEYSVQLAEQTDFAEGQMSAVCVAQALHWFDFEKFFAEVQRVAKRDALFVAWGYDWFLVDPQFDDAFESLFRSEILPFWSPQVRHLWNGYSQVDVPFERWTVPPQNIELEWTFEQLFEYVFSWSATKCCIDRRGGEFLKITIQELRGYWGKAETRKIRMPLHLLAGRING